MKTIVSYALLTFVACVPALGDAFDLSWFTFDSAGTMFDPGGGFTLSGTVGQPDAGGMTGGGFSLTGGFWPVAAIARGDLNCDGRVNNFDITPFVLALTAMPPNYPEYYSTYPNCNRMNADINGDGLVNNFDISPFVAVLTGG